MKAHLPLFCAVLFVLLLTACATSTKPNPEATPRLKIDPNQKGCTFQVALEGVRYDRAVILEELNADEVKVLLPDRNGWDPRLWVNMLKSQVLRVGQYLVWQGRRCMCPPSLWGGINPNAAD